MWNVRVNAIKKFFALIRRKHCHYMNLYDLIYVRLGLGRDRNSHRTFVSLCVWMRHLSGILCWSWRFLQIAMQWYGTLFSVHYLISLYYTVLTNLLPPSSLALSLSFSNPSDCNKHSLDIKEELFPFLSADFVAFCDVRVIISVPWCVKMSLCMTVVTIKCFNGNNLQQFLTERRCQ